MGIPSTFHLRRQGEFRFVTGDERVCVGFPNPSQGFPVCEPADGGVVAFESIIAETSHRGDQPFDAHVLSPDRASDGRNGGPFRHGVRRDIGLKGRAGFVSCGAYDRVIKDPEMVGIGERPEPVRGANEEERRRGQANCPERGRREP